MTDVMWSFRTEAQRDWFILKWCDEIYKEWSTNDYFVAQQER
jgi:hypothetical protein